MKKGKLQKILSGLLCTILALTCILSTDKVHNINAETVPAENTVQINTELLKASYGPYNIDKDTLPFTQTEIYNQLFDINNIISVDVNITNEEIKKLQRDFSRNEKSPIYRMADVTISITIPSKGTYIYEINEVGIRLKGNTTRLDLYDESKGIYNLDHFKLSFKQTFDKTEDGYTNGEYYINADGTSKWNIDEKKVRKNRTFGNMEKIDVKWNSNLDTTYIREYYAFELFRSEGICAPHIGYTTMQMNITDKTSNSEYLGVYTIHEPVDSEFVKNNLLSTNNSYIMNSKGDYTDGDLYKAGWAPADGYNNDWKGANLTSSCTYGLSDDLTGYKVNYDLKTNKKKSDKSPIKNLLTGLSNVSSKSDLSKYVDMDYFVKFAAVAYVVGNGDDMRNNYNNYYLYFYTDNTNLSSPKQKLIVIPYDYDRAFGITNGYNPEKTGMTAVDPYSTKTAAQGEQANPLYRYSVCKGGYYTKEYTAALKKVMKNKLVSMSEFEKVYNIVKKNYADKVTPSKHFENISKDYFYFTLDTNNDVKNINTTRVDTDDKNIIVSDYFTKMMNTLSTALENSGSAFAVPCYLRGEFNSWNVDESYKMTYNKASGLQSFKLDLSDTKSFKIYNSTADQWFGFDSIAGSTPSGVTSDGDNGNIKAQSGTYYIIYNPENNQIQISNQEIETETTTEEPTTEELTTEKPSTEKPSIDNPTSSEEQTTTLSKVISLTMNGNGGTIGSSKSYTKKVTTGNKIGILKNPKRKKYTFSGWYTKKSGGSKVTSSTKCKFTKNTTLYARWKKVSVGKAKISGLKSSSSKKMSVVIKKVSGAKGYEIVYAANSKFKSAKKLTTTSLSKTIKNLNKGKIYYVKVRAYKNDSAGSKVYGSYSAVRKVKIK